MFHRWHHTALERGGSRDFAGTFPIWDLMVGTLSMPANALPDACGIDDKSVPEGFGAQMLYPFQRSPRRLRPRAFAFRSPICSQIPRSAGRYCGRLVACSVLEISMAALFGGRLTRQLALTAALAATLGVLPAQADSVTVNLDQAQVVKLPEKIATIVVGNPLIADASLQSGGILVITGKGYGATNILALDRGGRVVMEKTVHVLSVVGNELVVVYRGIERESYNCAPKCERRITLGDSTPYFNAVLGESGARNTQAQAQPR